MKNYNELKWYVLLCDFNKDEMIHFNIFNSTRVHSMLDDALKHYKDYESFKKTLEKIFKYNYWSKAEYEILVSRLCEEKQHKIDVWYQIEPNLDLIARYIIETYNKKKRKKIEI